MIQKMKGAVKSVLFRLGYELRRVNQQNEDVDFKAALTVKEAEYYAQWVGPCPLFSPWLGHPDFQAVHKGVEPYTLVSPDRCYMLMSFARYAAHLSGDFAECGIWKGGTALLLARVLQNFSEKRLYLFDSFQGLPDVRRDKDLWFQKGQYKADSVHAVAELLTGFGRMIEMRPGWIPKTFEGLEDNRYAFVHLDVDIYQSNWDCCRYFYPRMVPGGVLLFDEYAFAAARGEKDAVDEFFADKPEFPTTLPTGQAFVLKTPWEFQKTIEHANSRFTNILR